MNNLDPLVVSTGPSQSHSPRLNRRDTINVRATEYYIERFVGEPYFLIGEGLG